MNGKINQKAYAIHYFQVKALRPGEHRVACKRELCYVDLASANPHLVTCKLCSKQLIKDGLIAEGAISE